MPFLCPVFVVNYQKCFFSKLRYPQNGVEQQYGYNYANLVTTLTHWKNGERFEAQYYTYTPDGNQSNKRWGAGREVWYAYDRFGRLTREEDVGRRVISYTYDRFSNRTKLTVDGVREMGEKSFETVYTYDSNNRLLTEVKTEQGATETTTYAYDRNGNQTRRGWQREEPDKRVRGSIGFAKGPVDGNAFSDTRVYNASNQLVQVHRDGMRVAYAYRPDGLRHSKTVKCWTQASKNAATVYLWTAQPCGGSEREHQRPESALPARCGACEYQHQQQY